MATIPVINITESKRHFPETETLYIKRVYRCSPYRGKLIIHYFLLDVSGSDVDEGSHDESDSDAEYKHPSLEPPEEPYTPVSPPPSPSVGSSIVSRSLSKLKKTKKLEIQVLP
ncbi:unnamed protein product [Arabis nemorensis]|uniref:Uncharacterized protein n=1 Tax=Arabis nemorensis TaxID=586526 RepID=A0A565BGI3_9BRAS|nr:unnamed protein product [Arabis nemorensis]